MIDREKISDYDQALISAVWEATSACDIDENAEDEEVRKFLHKVRVFLNHREEARVGML